MKIKRLKSIRNSFNKRGSTLVEVVVSITVLAIIVVTVTSGLCMAQQSVLDYNGQEDYSAQAQYTMDSLITLFANNSSATIDNSAMETNSDAKCANSGLSANWTPNDLTHYKQFYYQEATISGGIKGYNITVRVYFNSGKRFIEMTNFAANSGGALK